MPTGRDLLLGTIFKGQMDPSFTRAVNTIRSALGDVNRFLNQLSTSASTTTTRLGALNSAMRKSGSQMRKTAQAADPLNKQISRARDGYTRFLAAMKVTASYGVAASAIFGLVRALRAGLGEIVSFDQGLKNLQAITGATSVEIEAMGVTIEDVARRTKFSTSEVAEGAVLLGQAGFTAEESMQALNSTAMLATGTLSDFRTAADLMTTTIRAFNLDATESARVADVMANAINKSKLTVDKLRVAFNFVGAAAAQANLSIEQTAATMQVLANNGLRASTIGTGFRQVLARMIAPNRKLRETMAEHNIELSKINPLTQGWEMALKNLTQVLFDQDRQMIDVGKAFELFGLRGAQAVAIISKSFLSGDFQRALDFAFEVGTAEEMAAIQAEGLELKLKNLQDRAKLVALAIGDAGLTGSLRGFIDLLREGAAGLESFIRSDIGQITTNFVLLTGAVTGLALAFKGLIGVFKIAGIASFVTNPVLTATAAVVAFVAVMLQLSRAQRQAAEASAIVATRAKGVAQSIQVYRRGLMDLHESMDADAPRQYEALLQRLIKEHPELAEATNLAAKSHEELVRILAVAEMEQYNIALTELTRTVTFHAEEVKKAEAQVAKFTADGGVFFKFSEGAGEVTGKTKELVAAEEELRQKLKAVQDVGISYVSTLTKMVQEKHRTEQAARAMLEAFIKLNVGSEEVAVNLRKRFKESIDAMNATTIEMNRRISELLQSIPVQYQRMFSNLDALRQADLVKAVRSADKQIAAFEKAADEMGIVGKRRQTAIEAIEQRQVLAFLAAKEKEVTGEELTAQRRLEIIQAFRGKLIEERDKIIESHRVQGDKLIAQEGAIGERRIEISFAIDEKIEEAKNAHIIRLNALEILRKDVERDAAQERLDLQLQNYEKELEAKRHQIERLNALDELAVAKEEMTQAEAMKRKLDREIQFLEEVISLRTKAVTESAKLYGQDSENYKNAVQDKIEAERKLELAQIKRETSVAKAEKKAEDTAEKVKAKTEEVEDTYTRVSGGIASRPIKISADTTQATQSIGNLSDTYTGALQNMIASYARIAASGFNSITAQTLSAMQSKIRQTMQNMKNVQHQLENNPFLRSIQDQLGGTGSGGFGGFSDFGVAKPAPVIESGSATPQFIGGTSFTKPVETVNLNVNVGGQPTTFEVVNRPGLRTTIEDFAGELEKIGLSHG